MRGGPLICEVVFYFFFNNSRYEVEIIIIYLEPMCRHNVSPLEVWIVRNVSSECVVSVRANSHTQPAGALCTYTMCLNIGMYTMYECMYGCPRGTFHSRDPNLSRKPSKRPWETAGV